MGATMSDTHPLDWYPEPNDDPRGVPVADVERWVTETLAYEDSRSSPSLVAVLVSPTRPSRDAALDRARAQWDKRVYFMRCLDCRLIKIGFSKDVAKRKAQIERSTEHVLEVLGTKLGDRWTEAQLHGSFIHERVKGEWFRESEALLKYIAENTSAARGRR